MSPKLMCHENSNITETEISPKLKYPKLKCHQNLNITKTQMSPKLKYHLELNVTKTKISPKLPDLTFIQRNLSTKKNRRSAQIALT